MNVELVNRPRIVHMSIQIVINTQLFNSFYWYFSN